MELYYHELDRSVLILTADGALNSETAASFVAQLQALTLVRLNKLFDIYPDVNQARLAFREPAK
jgi:hypothetical protein